MICLKCYEYNNVSLFTWSKIAEAADVIQKLYHLSQDLPSNG